MDTTLVLKWLQDNRLMGLLGVHNVRASSVVTDSNQQARLDPLNNTVLDDGTYATEVANLASGNTDNDSWHEVISVDTQHPFNACVGSSFKANSLTNCTCGVV